MTLEAPIKLVAIVNVEFAGSVASAIPVCDTKVKVLLVELARILE